MKIKITYETEKELAPVLRQLQPLMQCVRIKQDEKQGYKHLYIEFKRPKNA